MGLLEEKLTKSITSKDSLKAVLSKYGLDTTLGFDKFGALVDDLAKGAITDFTVLERDLNKGVEPIINDVSSSLTNTDLLLTSLHLKYDKTVESLANELLDNSELIATINQKTDEFDVIYIDEETGAISIGFVAKEPASYTDPQLIYIVLGRQDSDSSYALELISVNALTYTGSILVCVDSACDDFHDGMIFDSSSDAPVIAVDRGWNAFTVAADSTSSDTVLTVVPEKIPENSVYKLSTDSQFKLDSCQIVVQELLPYLDDYIMQRTIETIYPAARPIEYDFILNRADGSLETKKTISVPTIANMSLVEHAVEEATHTGDLFTSIVLNDIPDSTDLSALVDELLVMTPSGMEPSSSSDTTRSLQMCFSSASVADFPSLTINKDLATDCTSLVLIPSAAQLLIFAFAGVLSNDPSVTLTYYAFTQLNSDAPVAPLGDNFGIILEPHKWYKIKLVPTGSKNEVDAVVEACESSLTVPFNGKYFIGSGNLNDGIIANPDNINQINYFWNAINKYIRLINGAAEGNYQLVVNIADHAPLIAGSVNLTPPKNGTIFYSQFSAENIDTSIGSTRSSIGQILTNNTGILPNSGDFITAYATDTVSNANYMITYQKLSIQGTDSYVVCGAIQVSKWYDGPGENEDGSMTQKAITNTIKQAINDTLDLYV